MFAIIFSLTVLSSLFHKVEPSSLTYCDGPYRAEKTRDQCGAGISFGDNRPECVCVSGIYRFLADTCETADGFAHKVCTRISDDNGLGANIIGVKFTRDPLNWAQTGIVCDKKGFGSDTWDFVTENHGRGAITKSANIYGVNGKAFITAGHHNKQAFCVQPAKVEDDEKVCRYLKTENEAIWVDSEVEVFVRSKCDGTALVPHKCFGILNTTDSECELSCSSAPPAATKGRGFSNKKSPPPLKGKSSGGPTTPAKPEAFNALHPALYWRHDNKFLNRKMMIYNIVSQLGGVFGDGSGNDTSGNGTDKNKTIWGEPKRTFEIFDMMKVITTSYCPDEYVSRAWVDLVIEMFYILHKGNIFRYDENLTPFEYKWIKDILGKCHMRLTDNATREDNVVHLTSQKPGGGTGGNNYQDQICQSSGSRATGYCNGTMQDGECNFKPIYVEPHRANDSYHYVPDVAWNIVDIIQVLCFKEFNESYRMFHVLEQAAEKLFTLQIKNLWYYPQWSEKMKKRLLGNSADVLMHNMEVCVYSAYDINGQIPRLVRPTQVKVLRKKRALNRDRAQPSPSNGQFVDVFCGRTRKDLILPRNCPKD